MTNNESNDSKAKTIVISATGSAVGTVDTLHAGADPAVTPAPATPTAAETDQAGLSAPATTAANTAANAGASDVKYEPIVASDPGEVTEQFDHLATRDPELMERSPEAPDAAATTGVANVPTELEREAMATTSANEMGYQNPEASADHAAESVQELRGAGHVEGVDTDRDVAHEVDAMLQSDKDI